MTRVWLFRSAPTRSLAVLSLLGLAACVYGCSSDGTSPAAPLLGGSGNAGSGASGAGAGSSGASGGEAGAPNAGDAGTSGTGAAGASGSAGSAGASGSSGAAGSSGASGSSGAGGSSGKGGASGSSGASGSGASGSSGTGGTTPSACGNSPSIGSGTELPLSTASDDTFGGISPSELTIAWTVVASSTVTLWYADRASPTDSFGAPQSLLIAAAPDRVTVGYDGLSVAFVDTDRNGFSQVTRAALGDAFANPAPGDFANLAAAAAMLPSGESYGDPLLTASGFTLFYSRFGGGRAQTLFAASRFSSQDAWSPGGQATLPSSAQASGANRFHPSGLAFDGATLFGWNDATSSELALAQDPQTGDYLTGVDLGNRRNAAPNADCSRIYYSAPGTSGMDLFVANVQ